VSRAGRILRGQDTVLNGTKTCTFGEKLCGSVQAWGDRLVICPLRWNEVIPSEWTAAAGLASGAAPASSLAAAGLPYRLPPRPRSLTTNRLTGVLTAQRALEAASSTACRTVAARPSPRKFPRKMRS